MNALILVSINPHTKFEVPSFTYSKDMTGAPKFKNKSWPWTHRFDIRLEQFDDSSLSGFRDMKVKINHMILATPISGWFIIRMLGLAVVNLTGDHIWCLYLYELERYERRRKM